MAVSSSLPVLHITCRMCPSCTQTNLLAGVVVVEPAGTSSCVWAPAFSLPPALDSSPPSPEREKGEKKASIHFERLGCSALRSQMFLLVRADTGDWHVSSFSLFYTQTVSLLHSLCLFSLTITSRWFCLSVVFGALLSLLHRNSWTDSQMKLVEDFSCF